VGGILLHPLSIGLSEASRAGSTPGSWKTTPRDSTCIMASSCSGVGRAKRDRLA